MWVSVVEMALLRVGLGALSLDPKRRFMVGSYRRGMVVLRVGDDAESSVKVSMVMMQAV